MLCIEADKEKGKRFLSKDKKKKRSKKIKKKKRGYRRRTSRKKNKKINNKDIFRLCNSFNTHQVVRDKLRNFQLIAEGVAFPVSETKKKKKEEKNTIKNCLLNIHE